MKRSGGFNINLYCSSSATIPIESGNKVIVKQLTDYPAGEKINISVDPDKPAVFTVSLRVPEWSKRTEILINGNPEGNIVPGKYHQVKREWENGDKISLKPDMTAHLKLLKGYQALVRGPVVLARDSRFGDRDTDEAAVVSAKGNVVELKPVENKPENIWMAFSAPVVLGTNLEGEFRAPRLLNFCDFASAGNTWEEDSRYRVWLKQTLNVMNKKYT
jgi:DUF1680 family protein